MGSLAEVPPVSGLIAGKYQIVRLLGRGGMGSVWEGRHATLGTRVAIKLIDSEFLDSQEARQRFENEARAAASIESRFAVTIYDYGVSDEGHPYIVMEYLQGEPLDKRIARQGRLSLDETCKYITQTARALQKAHAAGIVHRDLKPDNIYIVDSDDEEIAKLLDFGIAKFRAKVDGDSRAISSSTKTGTVIGTPFYMSPEQARGLRSVDYRTDLWSLGVIAYTCVTGALPFDGESTGDLLVKICTAPLPIPTLLAPWLPANFDLWFARALQREPGQRFQNAQELAEALTAVASGYPLPFAAVPPGTPASHVQAYGAAPAALPIAAAQSGFESLASPYRSVPRGGTDAGLAMSPSGVRKGSTSLIIGAGVAAAVGLVAGLAVVVLLASRKPSAQGSTDTAGTTSTAAPLVESVPTNTVPSLSVEDAGPRVEMTRPAMRPAEHPVGKVIPIIRPPSREPPPAQKPPPAYTPPRQPQPHDPAGF